LVAIASLFPAVPGAEPDTLDIKAVTAARTALAPVIDGRLDDEAWKGSPWAEDFLRFRKDGEPAVKTRFAVRYDDQRLYLAVACDEPAAIQASDGHGRDSYDTFRDDSIEIFIDPLHDHRRYVHLALNAAGALFDERGTDPSWDGASASATATVPGGWSLELSVPWKDLGTTPAAGTVIGLNLCRNRTAGGELVQWARTATGFHDPPRFGHVLLTDSAEAIAAAEGALRMGGRLGQIRISGPAGLAEATAPLFSAGTLARLDRAIADLPAGTADHASARLAALLAGARQEADALRRERAARGAAGALLAAERTALRRIETLEGDAWGARLADLLERIASKTRTP
jgi:hypothetical protein